MKFLDRLTGEKIEKLPQNPIISGRYQTLKTFSFNQHTELVAGELILDDGSGRFFIENQEYKFQALKQTDNESADTELANKAINTIAKKLKTNKTVSPMLPAELVAFYELNSLEKQLSQTLEKGHLQNISDQPRKDLRYIDSITPVSRAKRLANSAINHLASHSDCWQQRTLSGILPKKILAQFSEDDYAIYENRLYKRLLDRLATYLLRRLNNINAVIKQLEKALNFQNSEQTDYRLRERICTLWGEVYHDDNTDQKIAANKQTIESLNNLLRRICGLKQHGLYKLIPKNASVPEQLHRTNVLNHDADYRHIPPLWENLCKNEDNIQLTPKQRLEQKKQLHQSYSAYIGLVIRYALEQSPFKWADKTVELQSDQHDWVLKHKNGNTLKIIPIAWHGEICETTENVICYPAIPDGNQQLKCFAISPLDLYVVERIGKSIDEWLVKQLIMDYAEPLPRIPIKIHNLINKWTEFKINNNIAILIEPLNQNQTAIINQELTSANTDFIKNVLLKNEKLIELSRLCGHEVKLSYTPPNHFFCKCTECGTTWEFKNKTFSKLKNSNSVELRFDFVGRDWLQFEL